MIGGEEEGRRMTNERGGKRRESTDLSGKGHEVVFAETSDVDIAHDDHLVVVLCEYCVVHLMMSTKPSSTLLQPIIRKRK